MSTSKQTGETTTEQANCSLPDWGQISDKLARMERINPLEQFIWDNEPNGDDCIEWREQLRQAVEFLKANAPGHPAATTNPNETN